MRTKSCIIFLIFMASITVIVKAQNSIVVVTNPEGIQFQISRNNLLTKGQFSQFSLMKNDIIICKNLKKLKFNWAPYATGIVKNDSTMQITIISPQKKDMVSNIIESISTYLGFCEEDSKSVQVAIRNNEKIELPGEFISGLKGYAIPFSYSKKSKIIISDSNDTKVFEKELTANNEINTFEEIPIKMKMVNNNKYHWMISSGNIEKKGIINMISSSINNKIEKVFTLIDAQAKNNADRLVNKASYLQILSDASTDDLDFYWLSYNLLKSLSSADNLGVDKLLDRYYKHISRN